MVLSRGLRHPSASFDISLSLPPPPPTASLSPPGFTDSDFPVTTLILGTTRDKWAVQFSQRSDLGWPVDLRAV